MLNLKIFLLITLLNSCCANQFSFSSLEPPWISAATDIITSGGSDIEQVPANLESIASSISSVVSNVDTLVQQFIQAAIDITQINLNCDVSDSLSSYLIKVFPQQAICLFKGLLDIMGMIVSFPSELEGTVFDPVKYNAPVVSDGSQINKVTNTKQIAIQSQGSSQIPQVLSGAIVNGLKRAGIIKMPRFKGNATLSDRVNIIRNKGENNMKMINKALMSHASTFKTMMNRFIQSKVVLHSITKGTVHKEVIKNNLVTPVKNNASSENSNINLIESFAKFKMINHKHPNYLLEIESRSTMKSAGDKTCVATQIEAITLNTLTTDCQILMSTLTLAPPLGQGLAFFCGATASITGILQIAAIPLCS
jgi:hypothetical protein